MRIAILREHMVKRTPNHAAISDQIDQEIKTVLRDTLGAELVESVTPGYPDDPAVPNLRYTFADAFSEMLPRFMPEIFSSRTPGELMFAVPGYDVTSYDYLLKLSRREAPLTRPVRHHELRQFRDGPAMRRNCATSMFDMDRYLADRAMPDQRLGRLGGEREVPRRCVAGGRARTGCIEDHLSAGKGDGSRAATSGGWRSAGDVRERHRRVRAPGEHRADAEDSGPECRHAQPGRHHAVPADPSRRRAGRLQRNRLRAAVRAERGQDRLHLGPAAGHAAASCRTRCRSRSRSSPDRATSRR